MKTITISARSLWSIIIALAILGVACIISKYIIAGLEEIKELPKKTTNITIDYMVLMWVSIVSYLLIGSFILMIVRIFKKLKPFKEKALIWNLLVVGGGIGLAGIFVGAIIIGMMGYILGFKDGSIYGSIAGLTVGLAGGILLSLIIGLKEEFWDY